MLLIQGFKAQTVSVVRNQSNCSSSTLVSDYAQLKIGCRLPKSEGGCRADELCRVPDAPGALLPVVIVTVKRIRLLST